MFLEEEKGKQRQSLEEAFSRLLRVSDLEFHLDIDINLDIGFDARFQI